MIKKTKIFINVILLLLLFFSSAKAQDLTLDVTGYLTDEITGDPIPDHLVIVTVSGIGTFENYEFYTDYAGFYGSDSIPCGDQGVVLAITIDCIGVQHIQQDYFYPDNYVFIFDFEICTDSIPPGDCQASFFYEPVPGAYATIMFFDTSIGNPSNWLWDFGDGTTSSEQNPVHPYNTLGTYPVCLTIWDTIGTCQDFYCKDVIVTNGGGDCENWFWYETNDNITFDFYGESFPYPASDYFWDFGDGETGYGQNITHTYDTALYNNIVWVTLTTVSYDPNNADSCIATSTQVIWVGNQQGNCQADFYYDQDTTAPFTVYFYDNSTGYINEWFWDFGDGNFSEEQNPIYTYAATGDYEICLTIISDTLGMFCTDTYCQTASIGYSLTADFGFYLDTISGNPNRYYFNDASIGEPDFWYWDFGDGNISMQQNPVHQYQESGEYEVCLEVSRDFPNAGTFVSYYCQTIVTPDYFDIGGLAYIDDYPLNNCSGDTTIIDTGIVYLYRKYGNSVIPVDTNIFYQYGYYWFSQVREGDYIVKVGLTENSQNYNNYLTAYHESAIYWNEANTIHLYDTDNYEINVNLAEVPGTESGPGNISGSIYLYNEGLMFPFTLADVEILLSDENNNPLTFCLTDESGNFTFNNIALNTYNLYAEATGLFSEPVTVILTEDNPSVTDVSLKLYNYWIGVEEYFKTGISLGNVYPNPVREKFSVDIKLDDNAVLMIDIFNISGQKVKEQIVNLNKGSHILSFNCDVLPHGVYLFSLISEDRKIIETRKFVK